MKKNILLVVLSLAMHFYSVAQDVTLPQGALNDWLQQHYPSCFINYDINGNLMLHTSCSAITSEDSLTISFGQGSDPVSLNGLQYFTSLTYLDISQNAITNYFFPPNVQTIDCSRSIYTQPYGTISGVPASVTKLICRNNLLSAINISPNIRYLDLSGNSISNLNALPATLDTLICPHQEMYAPLTNILTSLGTLPPNLKYLDCSDNALSSLGTLPATLRYLNCSHQNVHTNPENIQLKLNALPSVLPPSLEYLDCSANKLTYMPGLPSTLKVLNCKRNRFFDVELQGSGGLGVLVHEGISTLPALPAGLVELDISENKFTDIPHPLPAGLTKLIVNDNVKVLYGAPVIAGIECLPHLPASLTNLSCDLTLIDCIPNSGVYTMTPSLPLCSVVNNTHQCETNPVMQGYVFYDNNSNGIKDAGENFRPNVEAASGSGSLAYSNTAGFFELTGQIGASTVTVHPPLFYQAVPASQAYSFTGFDTTVSRLYALQPTVSKDSVAVSIVPQTISRPGFSQIYQINYEDVGTTVVAAALKFMYDPSRMTYATSTLPGVSNSNGVLTVPPINLTPGDRGNFYLNFLVNPAAILGDTIHATLNAFYNTSISTDSVFSIISGSYDPNDKQATPLLTLAQVSSGSFINYLVRFQNTGTDTAFNVVVTDVLNNQLDAASFQMIAASHAARIKRTGAAISFEFININLPDSNVNESMSHGYIRFRVKPLVSVTAGSVIPNNANIYFDYNTPVLTNTAQTNIQAGVVPLKLLSITAMTDAFNNANLTWTTAQEINTAAFDIERSNDGINFKRIGTASAAGNGNHKYQFSSPMRNSIEYFRIKMLDLDRRFEYSPVVHTKMNGKGNSLQLLSNPVTGKLPIELYDETLIGTQAYVIDNTGRRVVSFNLQPGRQDIDLGALQNGTYILVTTKETMKFLLVR